MAEFAANATLGLYRLLGLAARPLAPIFLARRARQGKEDPARLGERYGRASKPRPDGRLVWVHAASVGETMAVLPLIERIVATGASVVLTTVTVTSATLAAERLPQGAVHQYSPIDAGAFVRAFIGHWRPQCAIFVESEIWPETFYSLAGAGIPRIIVNGRLSARSFAGWRRYATVARSLFSRITLCLAQSIRDADHYRALGAPDVHVTGNLKFDTPPPLAEPRAVAAFRAAVGTRPVWVAASTHADEEETVAAAHRIVSLARPDLLTVIAPRHPNRGEGIAAALAAEGYSVARRSIGEPITPATDIYLADTLGELGIFYSVAPLAFMGGSLIPHGGQNPIEPLRLGAAVLHGPHVHNFADVYAAIDENGIPPVTDAASLATVVARLLAEPADLKRSAEAALAALGPLSGALDATMTELAPFLRAGAPRSGPARIART